MVRVRVSWSGQATWVVPSSLKPEYGSGITKKGGKKGRGSGVGSWERCRVKESGERRKERTVKIILERPGTVSLFSPLGGGGGVCMYVCI